jgi:uncharacterized protein YndB with AHSA1/START domain
MSKVLYKAIELPASVEKVWNCWTTTDGITSFFAPKAIIELEIGGKFELYFMLNNPEGSQGSENCKVLSYLPQKMLSFSWNAPPQFPNVRGQFHWYVINFIAINDATTKLELTGLGWQDTEEWNNVYDYFDIAWTNVLQSLKNKLS